MSKKYTSSYCLVIDSSIAHAAGLPKSKAGVGSVCRDFLVSVRGVCHRMAWTDSIKAEWDQHASSFSLQWLVTMRKLQKLRLLSVEQIPELREAFTSHCQSEHVLTKVLKDSHLIEAAIATDSRIASLDENARWHFSRLSENVECLRSILWVNPINENEKPVHWLEQGAPVQKKRRLLP